MWNLVLYRCRSKKNSSIQNEKEKLTLNSPHEIALITAFLLVSLSHETQAAQSQYFAFSLDRSVSEEQPHPEADITPRFCAQLDLILLDYNHHPSSSNMTPSFQP